MIAYIIRRMLYAVPILIGVNLITFILFFVVNSPDDIARSQLGDRRVTEQAVEAWKAERGYDKPVAFNAGAPGLASVTETIFFEKSVKLFVFDFGRSDSGRDIGNDISQRMWPSLAIAVPTLLVGILVNITFAMLLAFFRGSLLDFWGVVLCVVLLSVSPLFYIIGGQYVLSKMFHLVPISGYDVGWESVKFLILPVIIGVIAGIGQGSRWYRTIFLEEVNKDYVRTARAKGLPQWQIVLRHALRGAMIPVVAFLGPAFAGLLSGSFVVETIFQIPGLGRFYVQAAFNRDYTMILGTTVFLSVLIVLFNLLSDIAAAWMNPRLRAQYRGRS